ncbi:LEA type 2 family protein [Sedimenticola thiotaurini]|uniref:Lipoprotein n=1 Tax=Sedimenticola thiotaurini TaxID=1543721 RepID=A0A0F7JWH9_9GAMM|nr:LEA type 2 family protein [Sedimenticola thiotaurini]AKH20047.1 lipoprotein [Sedimenticola thiotaurini]
MRITLPLGLLLLVSLLLSGCAGMMSGYEKPQVNITSFALAPKAETGRAPRFNIGIQVINPNRETLALQGMSYSLEVEGNRVLSGATADLPEVPGYGMAEFVIEASPNLLGGIRLLSDLFTRQRDTLGFRFKARIDAGGILPYINLEESGSFSLSESGRSQGI